MNIKESEMIREKLDAVMNAAGAFTAQASQMEMVRGDLRKYISTLKPLEQSLLELVKKCDDYLAANNTLFSESLSPDAVREMVTQALKLEDLQLILYETSDILASCREKNEALSQSYSDALAAFQSDINQISTQSSTVEEQFEASTERIVGQIETVFKQSKQENAEQVQKISSVNQELVDTVSEKMEAAVTSISEIATAMKADIDQMNSRNNSVAENYEAATGRIVRQLEKLFSNCTQENAEQIKRIEAVNQDLLDTISKKINEAVVKLSVVEESVLNFSKKIEQQTELIQAQIGDSQSVILNRISEDNYLMKNDIMTEIVNLREENKMLAEQNVANKAMMNSMQKLLYGCIGISALSVIIGIIGLIL